MKMKQLSDEHYIVVNESESEENVLVYNFYHNRIEKFSAGARSGLCWPITHSTQPLEFSWGQEGRDVVSKKVYDKVKQFSLLEVKQLLGVVDVETKAHNWSTRQTTRSTDYWRSMVSTYVEAYNQALEDNKEKKYTNEDMLTIRNKLVTILPVGNVSAWDMIQVVSKYTKWFDEYVESLQPKTEWEVEFIDGKLRLKQ